MENLFTQKSGYVPLPRNSSLRASFDKLVNHIDAASGQIKDKDHWLFFVEQDLVKIEWEFYRLNNEPVSET